MDNRNPNRGISGERKAAYYIGLALTVTGGLLFFSIFISAAAAMASPFPGGMGGGNPGGFMVRAVIGMALMIGGQALMRVGARGLAGSGVILDPDQARDDVKPWSRMAGGIAKDALEEADIHLGGGGDDDIPFDEKLRRLEKLRADKLISEDEYQRKRAEILEQKW